MGLKSAKKMGDKAASTKGASLFGSAAGIDPTLSALFSKSAGPVGREIRHAKSARAPKTDDQVDSGEGEEADEELSELDEEMDDDDENDEQDDEEAEEGEDEEDGNELVNDEDKSKVDEIVDVQKVENTTANGDEGGRKRKRKRENEDLEASYMQRLAKEEEKEQLQREAERKSKRSKDDAGKPIERDDKNDIDPAAIQELEEEDDFQMPQHESLAPSKDETDIERASRTVFLGNVSTEAITSKSAKKTLISHLSSFLPALGAHSPPHKLDSFRFRSVAFSSSVPKKAAFARKDLMDATTRSTNAYAVYTTKIAAREAAKRLNGTIVLERHLRVDEVAHPSQTDHRRCVFVGNLGFVDDESQMQAAVAEAEGQKRKPKKGPPGDVEEGLWREFGKAGKVESVRVVRDAKTRVGKGFAYVQFEDQNAVEAALLFNEKKFPPLLPRKLRVVRAKKPSVARQNSSFYQEQQANGKSRGSSDRQPRGGPKHGGTPTGQEASLQGRAKKLLGKAGAAGVRDSAGGRSAPRHVATTTLDGSSIRKPESFVFEGHRASSTQGNRHLRLGGSGKKKGKPRNRSAKRGAAWKTKGAKTG